VLDAVGELLASPWIYPCVFLVSLLDGLFPFLPSDSTILAASVAAAGGRSSAPLIVLVAALGVTLGDEIGYQVGRRMRHLSTRLRGRALRVYTWAAQALHERGVVVISTARYIPFGRLATVLAAGASGFPRARFSLISAGSAVIWSASVTAVGYCSGRTVPGNPLLGLGIAVVVLAVLTSVVRFGYRRFQRSKAPRDAPKAARGAEPRPVLVPSRSSCGRPQGL
jgi:membrane protein DedA with SNARE-associated domain